MNSQRIKDKLKNISKDKDINFNILLREYMYDRFLERLSVSKYKFNFILKGGYYLSMLFGLKNRSTMDIDAAIKDRKLTKENLIKIINEIIKIDISDGANFTIDEINKIREEDEYGGYRVSLTVRIDNMKESFHFDVATGDPITPSEINYKYKLLIEDKYINVLAYNLETVLAEKIETILTRAERGSRMKDYYDIYLIMNFRYDQINFLHLKEAMKNTFRRRGFDSNNILDQFKDIKESKILESKWKGFVRKKRIANVNYVDTINSIEKLISICKIDDLVSI